MSVYKRGHTYWYKFLFHGQLIRDSAKTNSKTIAREAERARRRDLELGFNRITKRERLPLFTLAAKEWLASKSALTPLGKVYYEQYSRKLAREFGERLVSDITLNDIAALQRKRLGEGLSARTVNCEVATLRQILKHCSLLDAARLSRSFSAGANRLRTCPFARGGRQAPRCDFAESFTGPVSVFRSVARCRPSAVGEPRPSPERSDAALE